MLAVFGWYGHRQLTEELDTDFTKMQAATVARLAQSAAAPLWEVNAEAIDNMLKAEMASEQIKAIRVLDLGGQVFAGLERDATGKIVKHATAEGPPGIAVKAPVLRDGGIGTQTEKIGQLAMVFTRDHVAATIQRNARYLAVQIMLIDLALVVLLLFALRRVFKPLERLRLALTTLAKNSGNLQGDVSELPESSDQELGDVARAFNLSLRKVREEALRQEALLDGKAKAGELSRHLQDVDSYEQFGQRTLNYLSPWIGAEVAAFFLKEQESNVFRCVAGHGIAPESCAEFESGEGLAGEVVLSGKRMVCRELADGFLRIEATSVSIAPRTIAIVPVESSTGIIAVLELGYLHEPLYQDEILGDALPVISFSLELLTRKLATLQNLMERVEIEERQRLILNSMQDGLFGQDRDGCVTFINSAALRMLGFAEAELIGQHLHPLSHHHRADGSEFPREECPMFRTAQDGESRTVTDEVFWRKDGTSFPIDYTTTPLLEDGVITGAVISFRDSSERQKVEAELRTSQRQMRTLVDSIGSVITLKDKEGRYLLLNAYYQKAMGVAEADVLGKTAFDILPNEVAASIHAVERKVIETLVPITYEETIPRRDGSGERHYMTTKTPLLDDQGVAYGICGIATDITERRLQEQKLKEAMELQQAIFDNIPAGVFLTADGLIRQVNSGLIELLSAKDEVIVGQPASILFPSAQAYAEFGGRVGPKLGQGLPIRDEMQFCRRDGSTFQCRISGRPVKLSGFSRCAIWLLEDVTDLRQNEERLRSILDDSPLGVTILTEAGEQTYVNRRMAEIFGVSAEELKKRRTTEFWRNPEEREPFIAELKRNGKVSDYPVAMRRADGSEFDAVLNTRYIDLHDGRFLLTWFHDSTESKLAETRSKGSGRSRKKTDASQ